MSAEIICVGTELLLGDILNSNAQYLAQELANLGIPHYYQTVVGDNITRLHHILDIACQRSSILIFTGGLGPTPDDLTTVAIATFFNIPLEEKPEIIKDITEKFAIRGIEMTENNRKQAFLPQGASILPNSSGTAPGIIWQPFKSVKSNLSTKNNNENLTIFTFPGVPSEMKQMWRDTAVPFLKSQGWGKDIIYSRMFKFRGIGESALATKVASFFQLQNPTVAPYASQGEVKLRVSAKANSKSEAEALIEPIAQQIKEIAGLDYFGCDDDTIASVVGQLLKQRGETITVAESCTGGGLGAMLTEISGSSEYFLGGIIAYANQVKINQLGVSETDLEQHGAVSEVIAQQMALGVKKQLKSSWAVSITGIAGPDGGSTEKPVGLVYIGIANPKNEVVSFRYTLGEKRGRYLVRYLSANYALDQLRRMIIKY